MLVMVVFFISFRWIHLSTPLIRLFLLVLILLFFFQAEDGIRCRNVTGVQTCALPISDSGGATSSTAPPESACSTAARRCSRPCRSEERRVGKEGRRLMLVMEFLYIAFRWIHLSTPLIRLFRLVLIFLLMPTLNFLPVWFALSLLRFRLPSRLPMMFILWMVAMMVVIIPSRTV